MLVEFNYFILTKVSHSSFYHFFAVINIYTFRRTLRQLSALQIESLLNIFSCHHQLPL